MVECTESGYRWCWESEYCNEGVCARPRIWWQFEDSDGNDVMETYPYCYGDLYIRSGYSGTFSVNGYGFYNVPSWDDIWNRFWVDDSGVHINIEDYNFTPPYNGGRIKIASVGETFTKCVALVCYDWNTDGVWVAEGAGHGYIGTGGCVNIQCVEPGFPEIAGTVTDVSTGISIFGAEVDWMGDKVYTFVDGTYSILFPKLMSGPLICSASGYITQEKLITAPEIGTLTVNFQLGPIAPIYFATVSATITNTGEVDLPLEIQSVFIRLATGEQFGWSFDRTDLSVGGYYNYAQDINVSDFPTGTYYVRLTVFNSETFEELAAVNSEEFDSIW